MRILSLAGIGIVGVLLLAFIIPSPQMKPYSLVIEDRSGQFLQAFLASDGIWRLRTMPDEIPEKLKKILIEKEDRWFYYHPGFNPISITRALWQNMVSGRRVSGASTITMQVARMLEPKKRTYCNKLFEIFRAIQLELHHSKKEILEMYASLIPLGSNIEGLKSASMIYYQSPLERLNIAQLFDLILIPNDPNDLQPDKNAERLLSLRKHHAGLLMKRGLFSRQDSLVLWNTGTGVTRKQLPQFAPHFCLRIKNFNPKDDLVRSSLDLRLQRKAENLLSSHLRPWKLKGVNNGAMFVVDNRTKEVVAYIGSENFNDGDAQGQVDAVKALRSPGSTLKPFLFAFKMDRGELTPKTRLLDTPYDAEGFLAENYDGKYAGFVYADDALRHSLNVPMIRLLKETGVSSFIDFCTNCGITSLHFQKNKLGLSMIVGGCGVTLEELTAAYSAFPSGGRLAPLRYFKREEVSGGEKEVFSPSAAFMVTEILTGVDRPDLPNNFESSMNLSAVAYKTGTSYGRRDAWAIGYTAEYTVGVWIGNFDDKGNPNIAGSQTAAPLLFEVITSISSEHQKTILQQPEDVGVREVCAESGLAPTPYCSRTIYDLYSKSRTLHRECEIDKQYAVSLDEQEYYCPSCLGENKYKLMNVKEYPPELLSFWKAIGKQFAHAPRHNPLCSRLFDGNGPKITSPSDAMTYYFCSKDQKIALQASSGLDVAENIWYMDNQYLGRNKSGEKVFIHPDEGMHTITCLDEKGRVSKISLTVKYIFE